MSGSKAHNAVQVLWNASKSLQGGGVSYFEYMTELTYLLFLKMLAEVKRDGSLLEECIPEKFRWAYLKSLNGADQLAHYRHITAYHLDREATCNIRHQHVVELVASIDAAKAIWPQMVPNGAGSSDFDREAKTIVRKITKKAPYSGDMMFILRGHRSKDHPWIDGLLQSA